METRRREGAILPLLLVCGLMAGAVGWPAEADPAGRATVKGEGVPVYAQTATSSKVATTLKRGAKVTVDFTLTGAEGAWCHITLAGSTGYVRCEDLEREPAPSWQEVPAQPTPGAGGLRRNVARDIRELKKLGLMKTGGETPLMRAAAVGDATMVKAMLAQGADANATNRAGETALMVAAENGHFATIQALLEAGSAVDAASTFGETALMYAAENGHTAVVQALADAGADVNARNDNTSPVLQLAAYNGHTAVVQALAVAGAEVNAVTRGGYTALMWAAGNGHVATVKALLAVGADANFSFFPSGAFRPLTVLLQAEANPRIESRTEIIRLLKEAGAQE